MPPHTEQTRVQTSVRIDAATAEDADAVVEMWVSLARGQRSYGSHLTAEGNRKQIRDTVARHIVLDGLRVARLGDGGDSESGATDDASGAEEPSASERRAVGSDSEDADLVGFVMFDLEAGAYVQDVSRGVVRNLYVRPERRGDGIGEALLTTAEAALNDAGADVVTLEAMATNERAHSFYSDLGYTPHRIEFEKRLGETEENDTHTKVD